MNRVHKKMMIAIAIMACSIGLRAEPSVKTGTISTIWAQAVYTNIVTVPEAIFAAPVIGGSARSAQLDKIVLQNNTGSSASMAVEMEDIADTWVTLTGSPIVAATTAQTAGYPGRAVTETVAGYITTNRLVQFDAGAGVTNYTSQLVAVPVTSTVTKSVPYWVRRLRLITTLNSTNAPSTMDWAVFYSK